MTAPQKHQATPKGVSFAVVEVREYPRILGDSPSVSSGPPISISWTYDATLSVPVDEWERIRDSDRRTKQEIRVPEDIRRAWLIDAGYSGSEMQSVINVIAQDKKQRRSSIDKSDLQDKAEAFAEIAKRKLVRAVGRRPSSGALYKEWKSSSDLQPPSLQRGYSI